MNPLVPVPVLFAGSLLCAAVACKGLVAKQRRTRCRCPAGKQGRMIVNACFGAYRVTVDGKSAIFSCPKSAGAKLVESDQP